MELDADSVVGHFNERKLMRLLNLFRSSEVYKSFVIPSSGDNGSLGRGRGGSLDLVEVESRHGLGLFVVELDVVADGDEIQLSSTTKVAGLVRFGKRSWSRVDLPNGDTGR
jgi:hypothetical protein